MTILIEGQYKIGSKKLGPIVLYPGKSGALHVNTRADGPGEHEIRLPGLPFTLVVVVGFLSLGVYGVSLAARFPLLGTKMLFKGSVKSTETRPFNFEIDGADYVRGSLTVNPE